MSLELANRSVAFLIGIAEDVMVRVNGATFLADFVVINFEPDPRVPIILGRHFLRTAKALVDLYEEKLTLRVGSEELIFYANNSAKNKNKQFAHSITIIDFLKNEPTSGSTTIHYDALLPSSPLVETIESSIEKFTDKLTYFPLDFEDDPVFERFTFEPTPADPSPPGDVDIGYLLDDKPVYESFTFKPDPFKDVAMTFHYLEFERFTFDLPLVDSVIPSQDIIPILPSLLPFDLNSVYEEFVDELALLDPFPPGNEDFCFDPGAVCDEIEYLLYLDPSSFKLPTDTILKGFTDEPPLEENDDKDLFVLTTKNDE
ncbi:reverse transcriptase domain-containing protein [Tanacetum coccineum]